MTIIDDPAQLEHTIAGLVRDVLCVEVPGYDSDLVEAGLLDSLGVVSLIAELETELGFELALEDLEVDTFRTVRRIAAFVQGASTQRV
jgi:acyl carrier protein